MKLDTNVHEVRAVKETVNTKKNNNDWNGEVYRTSINKYVHTELFNELEKLPANVRVKRLLMLATIGLAFVKGQNQIVPVGNFQVLEGNQDNQTSTKNDQDKEFKNDTKNKLLSSLDFSQG